MSVPQSPKHGAPEPQHTTPPPAGGPAQTRTFSRLLFGPPRDPQDPHTHHAISLIALLAWVGLGADGLSSSAYGPDESFRALGEHPYLAVALALATETEIVRM